MMPCNTVGLDVGTVLQIAESLESVVSRCFGPEGGQVLFIKHTGEILITRDGKMTLESLLLDHPVARMIVECASKHYSVTGDGTKSFIILVCNVLRGLEMLISTKQGGLFCGAVGRGTTSRRDDHDVKRISRSLITFQTRVLENIIGCQLRKHFLSVFHESSNRHKLCREVLASTLEAYFAGRIGSINQKFMAGMASEYFHKCVTSEDLKQDVLSLVDECFFELHTSVTGLPVGSSKVLPGLVLPRDFAVFCPTEGGIQAIVATEPVHSTFSAKGFDFAFKSKEEFLLFEEHASKRTESFMKHLQNSGVNLLLSSVKQSEAVLYYARQSGISVVDCLPIEDISVLCKITGVSPEYNPGGEVLCGNITETVKATFCRPLLLGPHRYVHLGVISTCAFQPHCLVLCGPVKGLTDQHVSAFHGAFKMLRVLLKSYGTIGEHEARDDNCSPELGEVFCKIDQHHVEGRECVDSPPVKESDHLEAETDLHCKSQDNAKLECGLSIPAAELIGCTVNCLSQLPSKCQTKSDVQGSFGVVNDGTGCNCVFNSTCNLTNTTASREKVNNWEMHMQNTYENRLWEPPKSFIPAGSVLPVGGSFETLLHYYLHQHARQNKDAELSLVTTLFANAVLDIPRKLHRNQKGNRHFLQDCTAIIRTARTQQELLESPRGLESVACKYHLVMSALNCVARLVTIDMVIGIKKQPRNMNDSDCEQ